jgi:hypothetical protein
MIRVNFRLIPGEIYDYLYSKNFGERLEIVSAWWLDYGLHVR